MAVSRPIDNPVALGDRARYFLRSLRFYKIGARAVESARYTTTHSIKTQTHHIGPFEILATSEIEEADYTTRYLLGVGNV